MPLRNHSFVFAIDLDACRKLDPAEASEALKDDTRRVWLHLHLESGLSEALIRQGLDIPDEAMHLLTTPKSRPGIFEHEKGLLISLRGRNVMGGEDDEDMVSLRIWITPLEILTVERRPVASVREAAESFGERTNSLKPVEILRLVITRLNGKVLAMVDERIEEIDEIEALLIDDADKDQDARVRELRRDVVAMRRFMQPQRDVFERLASLISPIVDDKTTRYFLRSEFERVQRALEDLNMVRERAVLFHEEQIQRQSERMNRNMYVLSVIAAIFLPLTFLSGLLGMNVQGIPFATDPLGFAASLGLMGVAAIGMWIVLRFMKLL